MGAQDIDIDRLIDYKSEYWAYVKKPHVSGNNLTGLCPFHDDKNNSFSVDLETGKWHCLAEDIGGNFISFYAKIHGIDTSAAYKEILDKYGVELESKGTGRTAAARNGGIKGYSLSQYAFEKRLPEEWLKDECKIKTVHDRYYDVDYMKVPYMDEQGIEVTYRKRFANKEFRWKKGSTGKIGLYGEWKMKQIRSAGYVILVEGESDTQSLWCMELSALGVAGASMFKAAQAALLQDLKVYIHQEKDGGGETFFRKVTEGMRVFGFIGEVYRFSCGQIPECKDPSDVFTKFGKEDGNKKILKLVSQADRIDLSAPAQVTAAIKDAPVNLRQPDGWEYSEDGIKKFNKKSYANELVCRTPIILKQRLKSLDTGDEKIEIAFKRDEKWHQAIYQRSTLFTSRGIVTLSDLGCTVTSENAKQVVQFLSALESENIDLIPKADSTSTFGWQPGGRFIPGREQGIVLDVDPSQQGAASAYRKDGSLDGWVETMRPHRERDKFRFILAASFAAPLLKIIKQRTFFVYNWGNSKAGKTAALKAALSAWGDPERLMVNFNATQVGLERTAALYRDLPLGIDERQLSGGRQEDLERIVYMIANGKGKVRGAKSGGVQKTYSWRTVAIATGEEPLARETSKGGVSTRALEIYGGPFDDEQSASQMHQKSADNCGHAGPEFVNRIAGLSEESICEWYGRMQVYVDSISDGKSGSHVSGVAAVALADALINEWFFEGKEMPDTKELEISRKSWERSMEMAKAIMEELMSRTTGDTNENAVQFISDWVISNKSAFGEKAIGTCLGKMSESGNVVYLFPSLLQRALTQEGYSAQKTLAYMAEKELITSVARKDHRGKTYSVVRKFDGRNTRFVEFFIGKLSEKVDELDEAMNDDGGNMERGKEGKNEQLCIDGFMNLPDDMELPFD